MPLIPVEESSVPCPYCGEYNSVAVFDFIQWYNDLVNLKRLMDGNINTFECKNCHKIGWAKEEIKIYLAGNEKVILSPIPPDESPRADKLLGVYYFFYETLGQPLVLLKKFIDDYENKWQEKHKGNSHAQLFRQLD